MPQQTYSEDEWFAREERIRIAEGKQADREAKREELLDQQWKIMEEKLQAQAALIERLGEALNKEMEDLATSSRLLGTNEALAAYGEWRKENGGKV